MAIAISPKHKVHPGFPATTKWSLERKIDVFLARVDGWHLEIADRCVSGWKDQDGNHCISTPKQKMIYVGYPDRGWVEEPNVPDPEAIQHEIPDAAWAALQIVLNYFEIVGLFKCFKKSEADDRKLCFDKGVFDVFPQFEGYEPNIANILWGDLRGGLYHGGIKSGRIVIRHVEPLIAMIWNDETKQLIIDPHVFVRRLRQHLTDYGRKLRDPTQKELRAKFEAAYYCYYES
ncbi:MAG: hypothetical protein K8S97_15090 [Anaerolineae bacterium]|nr:hypothetical protein [Anaerolineae bacterium]